MNRDFIIKDFTPTIARKIVSAMDAMNAYIDPKIIEESKKDLLVMDGIDEKTLEVCQFISDYNHRCSIPFDPCDKMIAMKAISIMLPKDRKVIFLINDPIPWKKFIDEKISKYSNTNEDRYQYISITDMNHVDMLYERDAYIVANTHGYEFNLEWIGKLFSEIIIYREVSKQLAFEFRKMKTIPAIMETAEILYPHIISQYEQDTNLYDRKYVLPLIGVCDSLIESFTNKIEYLKNNHNKEIEIQDTTVVLIEDEEM